MSGLTVYSDSELKEIQTIEIEALKEIIYICQKIGVEYFLIGGTALGAVRHNGFIPWDDDIDIGMTRDQYRKFLAEAPKYLSEKYHLQTPYENYITPYFYSKLRIDGTKFVEYCNHRVNMHQGVYIDIFPFDNVPDDEMENKSHFAAVQKAVRLFTLHQSPDVSAQPTSVGGKIKAKVRNVAHVLCKVIVPDKILFDYLEKLITKYDSTETKAMACLNFPKWKTEYILKSDLYPLSTHNFEGIKAMIPRNYHQYLTTHYGDYMKLPPTEQRFGHKPFYVNLHGDE